MHRHPRQVSQHPPTWIALHTKTPPNRNLSQTPWWVALGAMVQATMSWSHPLQPLNNKCLRKRQSALTLPQSSSQLPHQQTTSTTSTLNLKQLHRTWLCWARSKCRLSRANPLSTSWTITTSCRVMDFKSAVKRWRNWCGTWWLATKKKLAN